MKRSNQSLKALALLAVITVVAAACEKKENKKADVPVAKKEETKASPAAAPAQAAKPSVSLSMLDGEQMNEAVVQFIEAQKARVLARIEPIAKEIMANSKISFKECQILDTSLTGWEKYGNYTKFGTKKELTAEAIKAQIPEIAQLNLVRDSSGFDYKSQKRTMLVTCLGMHDGIDASYDLRARYEYNLFQGQETWNDVARSEGDDESGLLGSLTVNSNHDFQVIDSSGSLESLEMSEDIYNPEHSAFDDESFFVNNKILSMF
jgi:hypothetical protein